MNDFIEKWKTDKKYQAKIKLSLYVLFIFFVTIFALSGRNTSVNNIESEKTNKVDSSDETNIIDIADEYKYEINISINDNNYKYNGIKELNQETIYKQNNETDYKYIYTDNKYYKEISDNYILTTESEVYDIIDINYLKLDQINEYLKISTKTDDKYIVYLKDIILNNTTDDYISIKIENEEIEIDYTNIIKISDNTIDKCIVNIKIEKNMEGENNGKEK